MLGITGTGGAGKSSLTDELIRRFRLDQKDNLQIAVIAIDPSRRKTGGALLGDRIRMNALSSEKIYMRSLATRGGGSEIAACLPDAISACKCAGFDLIVVAGRMDSYVEQFQSAGGSFVMLAKGNRSRQVTDSCRDHGGFYLGSIGGPAARLAQDNIISVEVLEYPELGMEAVWRIEVRDFPAFIVVDDKGNDFYEQVRLEAAQRPTRVSIG